MRDLTEGCILRHIVNLAAPFAMNVLTQIAYQLVNLYFISELGAATTAGVNAAGNIVFIVSALVQVLGSGTAVLVAHAAGRKDHTDANLVFNQAIGLAIICAALTLFVLCLFIRPYLWSVTADAETVDVGATYTYWMLPGSVLLLPMAAFSSSLRGVGIVKPAMLIYTLTVTVNAVLAPVLIAGWVTGVALGAEGAGLATSLSVSVGCIALGVYFHRLQGVIALTPRLIRPQWAHWRRLLNVGWPAGGESASMFFSTAVTYYAIREFGPAAQAGFGIGSRLLQIVILPGMSIAFAAAPIAGQNFGAGNSQRVLETFRQAVLLSSVAMGLITLLVQSQAHALVGIFDGDESTLAMAALYLQLMSWTFVAQGFVYTCTAMFQGLGHTLPSLLSSSSRLLVFASSAVWLSTRPEFRIEQIWYAAVVSIGIQTALSRWLLRQEFSKRLTPLAT